MNRKLPLILFGLIGIIHPVFACTLSFIPTNINFGAYNPFNTASVTTALSFTTNCSGTLDAPGRTITITGGNSSVLNRQMQNGANNLNYNLYTTLGNSAVWGDGSSGVTVIAAQADNQTQVIYATLPAQQEAYSGSGAGLSYSDSLMVSIGNGADSQMITVSANVPQACQIATSNINLSFGQYDVTGVNATSPKDSTSNVTIMCTDGSSGISLSMGDGLYLNDGQRRMKGTSQNYLNYDLYQPSSGAAGASCSYSSLWTSGNDLNLSSTPITSGSTYNICGRIPAGQTSALVDVYTDQVQYQVNY